MPWSSLLLLLTVLSGLAGSTKNVLVISSVAGSHQYLSADVASLFAERDHNVTLLSLCADPRVSFAERPFTPIFIRGPEYMEEFWQLMDDWVSEAIHLPTELGITSMFSKELSDQIIDRMLAPTSEILLPYFNGGQFRQLLNSVPFSLIVVEESAFTAAKLQLTKAGIPVVSISPVSEYSMNRARDNNPMLLNSEPNLFNTIIDDTPPSFSDRLFVFKQLFNLAMVLATKVSGEAMTRDFTEAGVTWEESDQILSAAFVFDHPALSFPALTPPYMFNMGFFHLDQVQNKPLPDEISHFIDGCDHVIYASFGTYAEDITLFPFVVPMLRGIAAVNPPGVCLILKTKQKLDLRSLELRILQMRWLPQKDLLASGKVGMFISHCGNNGRIESVFYGVPILCVPLFGDQYYNARMVERRQFGRLIPKESITEGAFRVDVEEFLGKAGDYRANMVAARKFVQGDSSSGLKMFFFICEHILNGGDLSFLKNKILQQQGIVEVYNLDILGIGLAVVALVTGLVLWVFWKCLRCTCRRVVKLKTE